MQENKIKKIIEKLYGGEKMFEKILEVMQIKHKKGFMAVLSSLPTIVIILGIVVIVVALVGSIVQNMSVGLTAGGYAANATEYAQSGWLQFSSYLPQVGLVAAAIILIALVYSIFNVNKGGKGGY